MSNSNISYHYFNSGQLYSTDLINISNYNITIITHKILFLVIPTVLLRHKPSRPWDITITSMCTLIVVSVQTKLDLPTKKKK